MRFSRWWMHRPLFTGAGDSLPTGIHARKPVRPGDDGHEAKGGRVSVLECDLPWPPVKRSIFEFFISWRQPGSTPAIRSRHEEVERFDPGRDCLGGRLATHVGDGCVTRVAQTH